MDYSFIFNSPKFETIQMAINREIKGQTVWYLYNRILLTNLKRTDTCDHVEESQKDHV